MLEPSNRSTAIALAVRPLDFGRAAAAALLARLSGSRPRDMIALAMLVAGAGAITVNALYLQPGPHPAPIFAVKPRPAPVGPAAAPVVPQVAPLKPLVAETPTAPRARAEVITDVQRELSRRGFYDGPVDGVLGPRTDAAIRDFAQANGIETTAEPTEELLRTITRSPAKPVPMPVPSPLRADPIAQLIAPTARVVAVQRALSEYGYGPLKANGVYGRETVAAIQKFERDRKLPVTGQISDRLLRELAAVTGRPLE